MSSLSKFWRLFKMYENEFYALLNKTKYFYKIVYDMYVDMGQMPYINGKVETTYHLSIADIADCR